MLLGLFAALGFPQAVVRFLPTYRAQNDWARMRGLVKRGESLMLVTGSVAAGLGTLALLLLGDLSEEMRVAFFIALWTIPLITLRRFQSAMCRAFHQVGLAYAVPRLLHPSLMICGGLLVVSLQGTLTGSQAVLIAAVAMLPVWGWQRWQFRLRLPSAFSATAPTYAFRSWLRVSLPLLWMGSMHIMLNQTDLLMIGGLLGPREAGFYKAATRMAAGTTFVLAAINAVAAPQFATLHAAGDDEALRRLVRRLAHWIFWPSLALAAGLCLFADVLLGIFGPAFPTARWAMVTLVAGQLVNVGTGPVGYLLNMTDHHHVTARVLGWSALLNVAMNALGIYLWGLLGAALATALCTVLWNVWMHSLVARKLRLRPSIVSALKPFLSYRETPA